MACHKNSKQQQKEALRSKTSSGVAVKSKKPALLLILFPSNTSWWKQRDEEARVSFLNSYNNFHTLRPKGRVAALFGGGKRDRKKQNPNQKPEGDWFKPALDIDTTRRIEIITAAEKARYIYSHPKLEPSEKWREDPSAKLQ